jgi:hypothetical protein
MKNKQLLFNLIIAGMTLGTTWAIRGQFGHEQGAAWAGAIGGLVILLLARREDWYNKMFKAALAAAIGWGLGGMMSYGRVVGFGRGTDFGNVYYGLLMLFIIGGLYGFIGGGLFGLTLTENKKTQVKWAPLIVQMVAGGVIIYFFLVYQFEWLMTPPRSELWAACLGMAIALTWFIARNGFNSALRVAVYAGLGGGFGFAFGNFLQVLGNVSEIQFNFWNVMEYSLGFFGGVGMAYGVFTSEWETEDEVPRKSTNLMPILLGVFLIPFIVWQQSFELERLQKNYSSIMDSGSDVMAGAVQWIALVLILSLLVWVLVKYYYKAKNPFEGYDRKAVSQYFIALFSLYIVFSLLITGAIVSTYRIEQYLYIVNLVIILMALPRLQPYFEKRKVTPIKWGLNLLTIIVIIGVLALIAINTHGEMGGAQVRFE